MYTSLSTRITRESRFVDAAFLTCWSLMGRSPDATLSMSNDSHLKAASLATTLTGSLLLFAIWLFVFPTLARAQSNGSEPTQVTVPAAQSEIKENSAELVHA